MSGATNGRQGSPVTALHRLAMNTRIAVEHAVVALEPDGRLRQACELVGGVSVNVLRLDIETMAGTTRRVVFRQHRSADFKQHTHRASLAGGASVSAINGARRGGAKDAGQHSACATAKSVRPCPRRLLARQRHVARRQARRHHRLGRCGSRRSARRPRHRPCRTAVSVRGRGGGAVHERLPGDGRSERRTDIAPIPFHCGRYMCRRPPCRPCTTGDSSGPRKRDVGS